MLSQRKLSYRRLSLGAWLYPPFLRVRLSDLILDFLFLTLAALRLTIFIPLWVVVLETGAL